MFTITITITQDENNNVTVKTVEPKAEQPKKKIGRTKKVTTKSKKPAAKRFQHLPEPMDVDFEESDDEDDSVPFETL